MNEIQSLCILLAFLQIGGFVLAGFMYTKGYDHGMKDGKNLFSKTNRKKRI